jgi:hypothetical protein
MLQYMREDKRGYLRNLKVRVRGTVTVTVTVSVARAAVLTLTLTLTLALALALALALTLALRPLQPGDVVREHEHPAHVDMGLVRDTTPAPGFNHHTKSLRRRKKEAFAAAEAARLEAGFEDAQKE